MIHWLWYTLPLVCLPGLERVLGGPRPPLAEPDCRRPLAVAAHPDDLEYFCGGTLCRLARAGAQVTAVIATRGEAGGDPARRTAEQAEAAARLGYSDLRVWDFADGHLRSDDPALRGRLAEMLEQARPDLLLTFDPVYPFPVYRHPDHLAVANAALAVWDGPALLFHTRRPDAAVEVTEVFTAKVAAFVAHRSQLPRRGTARLAGFHLKRRNAAGRRRYVEVFRRRPPPPPGAAPTGRSCP